MGCFCSSAFTVVVLTFLVASRTPFFEGRPLDTELIDASTSNLVLVALALFD